MECPKCGYDREPEDTHCSLCGANFIILDEQMAAQEALRQREMGGQTDSKPFQNPSQPEQPTSTVSPPSPQPPADENVKQCPKCEGNNPVDAEECVECGIIFKRYEEILAQKEAEEEAQRQAEETASREKEEQLAKEREKLQIEARKEIEKAKAKRKKAKEDEEPKPESAAEEQAESLEASIQPGPPANPSKLLRNIGIAVAVLAVIGILAAFGVKYMEARERKLAEQAAIAKKQEEEKQKAEAFHKITIDFYDNREEIISRLRNFVDNREFEQFKENLKAYDIPPLAPDLIEIKKYFKEIELFESIKQIPGKEYQKNYQVYHELSQMAPGNKLYDKKTTYYRKKYSSEKYDAAKNYLKLKSPTRSELVEAVKDINTAIELEGKKKKYNRILVKLKRAELLYFDGNENVKMAIRDDGIKLGLRKIYIWLKNTGTEPFYINLDFFALICKDNKKYSYNDFSRGLIRKLDPGETAKGFLNFNTKCRPKKIVFDHSTAGTVFREFP